MKILTFIFTIAFTCGVIADDKPQLDPVQKKYIGKIETAQKKYQQTVDSIKKLMIKDYQRYLKRAMQQKDLTAANEYQAKIKALKGEKTVEAEKVATLDFDAGVPGDPKSGGWEVIFQSGDPRIWNTDSNKKDLFAVPVKKVPKKIKYLKMMRMDSKDFVIVEATKNDLDSNNPNGRDFYFNGSNWVQPGLHVRTLGIVNYKDKWKRGSGNIIVGEFPGNWKRGFGFGYSDTTKSQCYTWGDKATKLLIFQISVKTSELSASEKKKLLK